MSETTCGWLSPTGDFLPCEFGKHPKLALEMFPRSLDPGRDMELAGWWKLQGFSWLEPWCGAVPATEIQQAFIREWCHTNQADYPDFRGA